MEKLATNFTLVNVMKHISVEFCEKNSILLKNVDLKKAKDRDSCNSQWFKSAARHYYAETIQSAVPQSTTSTRAAGLFAVFTTDCPNFVSFQRFDIKLKAQRVFLFYSFKVLVS